MNLFKIFRTLGIYTLFFFGLLLLSLYPVQSINHLISPYLYVFSDYYGFKQFILSMPRRFIFGVYGLIFCVYWMQVERITPPIKPMTRVLFDYYRGFIWVLSCYLLSEVCYWIFNYSQILPCDAALLLKSSLFVLISSSMTAALEELVFRHILLSSFEKSTQRFVTANILQACVFAIAHILNPSATFMRFISWVYWGIFLGILRNKNSSIFLPIGFHSGMHYTGILNQFFEKTDVYSNNGTFMFYVITITTLLWSYFFARSRKNEFLYPNS
ncbi:MAG: CPBP family intramembrane metalloprotease [Gammaproteobacteria bacterium]|nr:CPBP family intramembrane metalloprotease [Gammaproteobacteria bacterium]